MENKQEIVAKIIVIGDSGVGKTSLLQQYCDHKFFENQMSTVGVDFRVKNLEIDGTIMKVQFWDTAGQERFRNITKSYYKGSQGVILVYSVIDQTSFQNISGWLKMISENLSQTVPLILLANKSDLTDLREVNYDEGKALAEEAKIPFYEVSAKENTNINEAIQELIFKIDVVRKNEMKTSKNNQHLQEKNKVKFHSLDHFRNKQKNKVAADQF